MIEFAIGTDIGGSHISAAAVDLSKRILIRDSIIRIHVNNQAGAEEILDAWCRALETCMVRINMKAIKGIGFAMPGPFDYKNGIALFEGVPKYQNLYGIHVADQIRERLSMNSNEAIRFINDATAFSVGEAWLGQAAGYERSVFITLGTGFGSAFLDKGIPVVERDDVPPSGCLWHLPYKEGIADDYFSTRWIINKYAEKTGKELSGVKEIADLVSADACAKEVFLEFGNKLGDFLEFWLRKFRCDILVAGGNISGAYQWFGPALEKLLWSRNIRTQTSISELKENAAMIGSARLLDDPYWEKIKPLLAGM